jgi:hypothetical protein
MIYLPVSILVKFLYLGKVIFYSKFLSLKTMPNDPTSMIK